jgi:uroporphyrinogen-III synthase
MTSPPLAGTRVWVTRPRGADAELPRRLANAGAHVIWAPTIAIDSTIDPSGLDRAVRSLEAIDWIVLTSVPAVDVFADRLRGRALDRSALARLRIAAVGPATARAMERHGVRVALVAEPHSAAGLAAALARHLGPGSTVLYPRAAAAPDTLARQLRSTGAQVIDVVAYRTLPASVDRESARALERGVDCVVFCSPSAIDGAAAHRHVMERATVACIGPTTARAARAAGLRVDVMPARATARALADAIVSRVVRVGTAGVTGAGAR